MIQLANAVRAAALRIQGELSIERRTLALALMRITLGLNVLLFYVQHFRQFHFLWGNDGVVPWPTFMGTLVVQRAYSLYGLSADQNIQYGIYVASTIVAFLFTMGLFTRWNSVLFFVTTWSIYTRNPYVLDGGDNLLYLVAFFMMFTDCGARLSVDAVLFKPQRPAGPFRSLIHNYAVGAIMAQTVLLYVTSAFYKISGHKWQDGTALYYILHVNEFRLVGWVVQLSTDPVFTTLMTYGTIAVQAAFPFLIFHRRAKWFLAPAIVGMHVGIGYAMGLAYFSAVMISCELVFFNNNDFRRMAHVLGSSAAAAYRALRSMAVRLALPERA